jgi:hypothetical protein
MAIGLYVVYSKDRNNDIIGIFTNEDSAKECAEKRDGFICCDEAYDSFVEWERCYGF